MKCIRSPEKISEGTCRGFGPRKIIPNSRADQCFLNWVSGSGYTVKIFLVIQILCILNIIYLRGYALDCTTHHILWLSVIRKVRREFRKDYTSRRKYRLLYILELDPCPHTACRGRYSQVHSPVYLFIFIADSETEIQNASQVGRNKVIEIRNAYGWSVQV